MFSNVVTMVVLLLSVVALVYTIIAGFGLHKAVKAKATSSTIEVEKIKIMVSAVVTFVLLVIGSVYTQDAGSVGVIRNFGGSIAGVSKDAGLHAKAPWQSVIYYDTRNNLINFYGADTEYKAKGGNYWGKQVSINDKSGASANVDIQVNYSLKPDAAKDLYINYGTQQSMTEKYISNDLRSVTREASGQFSTITMLTDRSKFTEAVQKKLSSKWHNIGLTVEQVSVQDVRYPRSITDAYAAAQAAEVNKQKAKNEQETARVQAETKKIKAKGDADANAILNNSLTDNVLKQKYIDALKGADNLTVVPNGSVPMIQTGK